MDSGESEPRAPFAFEGEYGVFVFRSGVSAMSRSPRLSQWTPMKTILTVDRDCGPSSKSKLQAASAWWCRAELLRGVQHNAQTLADPQARGPLSLWHGGV